MISRASESGIHLVRRSLRDGAEELMPLAGPFRYSTSPISPNSVAPDGRILAQVVSPALWSWPFAIIDPKTGSAELLPIYDGRAGWTPDGDILGVSAGVAGRIWRFRPLEARVGQPGS